MLVFLWHFTPHQQQLLNLLLSQRSLFQDWVRHLQKKTVQSIWQNNGTQLENLSDRIGREMTYHYIGKWTELNFSTQFLIPDTDLWWWILNPQSIYCNSQNCKTMGIKLKVLYSVVFTCWKLGPRWIICSCHTLIYSLTCRYSHFTSGTSDPTPW